MARAAISEIEQYNRVALKIQPGVMVAGHAVSDVVHLLAELIENATVFSASDTRVLVSVQELASGGVLIQVSDSGVGVSDTRLAEMKEVAFQQYGDRNECAVDALLVSAVCEFGTNATRSTESS